MKWSQRSREESDLIDFHNAILHLGSKIICCPNLVKLGPICWNWMYKSNCWVQDNQPPEQHPQTGRKPTLLRWRDSRPNTDFWHFWYLVLVTTGILWYFWLLSRWEVGFFYFWYFWDFWYLLLVMTSILWYFWPLLDLHPSMKKSQR